MWLLQANVDTYLLIKFDAFNYIDSPSAEEIPTIANKSSKQESARGPTKSQINQWYQQLSEGSLELHNMGLDDIPTTIFDYRQPLKVSNIIIYRVEL